LGIRTTVSTQTPSYPANDRTRAREVVGVADQQRQSTHELIARPVGFVGSQEKTKSVSEDTTRPNVDS
jgi:hypothetical protein